jgi:hypothetical protein
MIIMLVRKEEDPLGRENLGGIHLSVAQREREGV